MQGIVDSPTSAECYTSDQSMNQPAPDCIANNYEDLISRLALPGQNIVDDLAIFGTPS